MSNGMKKMEAAYQIGDAQLLHLRENEQGFGYLVFEKESEELVQKGQIHSSDLSKSPMRNPLHAALFKAMEEMRAEGESVYKVSLLMLTDCVETGIWKRKIWEPEQCLTMISDSLTVITRNSSESRMVVGLKYLFLMAL